MNVISTVVAPSLGVWMQDSMLLFAHEVDVKVDENTLGTILGCSCCSFLSLTMLVLGILVIRDTVRGAGRWGMNFMKVSCPRCSEPAPAVRVPNSVGQALWGGWTCAKCGTDYDKWGKEIPADVKPA